MGPSSNLSASSAPVSTDLVGVAEPLSQQHLFTRASRGSVIVLIGLPGSGKSTLARTWVTQNPSWLWVSSDRLRGQLFGDEATQGPWPLVWQAITTQLQQAHVAICQGEAAGVIYDATNVQRRSRRQVLEALREIGFGTADSQIIGVWVTTALADCLGRNQRRDRQVPSEVIEQMQRQLLDAPPVLDEGFDAIWQVPNGP
jgi:predicted kinase